MRIIEWPHFLEETSPFSGSETAITIGVFDGVHRGHKALIERVVAFKAATPVVVTFRHNGHKKSRTGREYAGEISSFRQKMAAFESLGIAAVIVIEFSETFRRMSGPEFLRILQDHGKMSFLAVGSNFHCGYQLDTDAQRLLELNAQRNIPTDIVQVLTEDSITISSSQIRAAINRGDMKTAAAMLGYPFTIDLAGISAVPAKNGISYSIKEHGRIIPPPGRYPVLLHGIKDKKPIMKPDKAVVEGGNLITSANPTDTCLESVEFLF
jgi:riboflavin kinase/FMN adenylyltransferase